MAKTPNTRSRPETRIIGLPVQKVCGIYTQVKSISTTFSHSDRKQPHSEILMLLGPLSFLHSLPSLGAAGATAASARSINAAAGVADNADSLRRFENLTRVESRPSLLRADLLMGGVPIVGMDWDTFAGVVIAAGLATFLFRRVQAVWEAKVRPFGSLSDINLLIHNWAVTDEDEARVMATNIGRIFLRSVREKSSAYDHAHFQVPYAIDPKEWGEIGDRRNALTGRYVRTIVETFRDFGRGLSLLSGKDYGDVYREFFTDFMDKIYLVIGPLTRWQDPPTGEDLHNFDHFRITLRREIAVLESKIRAIPVSQAV